MITIAILHDMTPTEKANSAARRVVFHLDMARGYLNRELWVRAKLSLRAAKLSLRFVDVDAVTDADTLRKITALPLLERRAEIEPEMSKEW